MHDLVDKSMIAVSILLFYAVSLLNFTNVLIKVTKIYVYTKYLINALLNTSSFRK